MFYMKAMIEKAEKDYSSALIELRSKLNISQTELAARMNVSFQTVNRWENNRTMPIKTARVKIEKMCIDNGIVIKEVINNA